MAQVEVAFFSPASRHVESLLKDACNAAGLPLTILTLRSGEAIVAHPENFKNASALSCRLSSAIPFDEMIALLLDQLVTRLNGTPYAGEGYATSLLRTYSAIPDEVKAARQSANTVFKKAEAAEAKAAVAAAAAAAPNAPRGAKAAAADAAAKARQARAEAEATRTKQSESAVKGNIFNNADTAEVAAFEARAMANAPNAGAGAEAAAEAAEEEARQARARAEATRAKKKDADRFNVEASAAATATAAAAAVAVAAPEELVQAQAAAEAAEEEARQAQARADATREKRCLNAAVKPAVTLQWKAQGGEWGFVDENGTFVAGAWSPPLSRTGAGHVLGALNAKRHLERNAFGDTLGHGWWSENALVKSGYEDYNVTNPAFVGPAKRVRAAAASAQLVGHNHLLALIDKMPLVASVGGGKGPAAAAPAAAPASGSGRGAGHSSGRGTSGRGLASWHTDPSSGRASGKVRPGAALSGAPSKRPR
jgi:chemotaxis protein histidine kinase CheA